jgi:hypothetical protein
MITVDREGPLIPSCYSLFPAMASARNRNGRNNPMPNIYESMKKGLDILLKAFRDDEEAEGTLQFSSELSSITLNFNLLY